MSAFSNMFQTLHTWLSKAIVGAGKPLVNTPTADPTFEEWQRRKVDVMTAGKRNDVVNSLWHDECSRCARYLSKSDEEVEQELIKLCFENYGVAFHSFTDCFDNSGTKSKSWKEKYPGLMSSDRVQVITTAQQHWQKMFPSVNWSQVDDEFKVLLAADSHLNGIAEPFDLSTSLDHYRRAIEAMAKIASTLQKTTLSEFIQLHFNERRFKVEANDPYTASCGDQPAYSFLGGSLTDKQLKWMVFAFNVAHVPDKEFDQIGYEADDEAAKLLSATAEGEAIH